MTRCYSHRIQDPFVRFNKKIVYDNKISLKAKGLLSIAFSRPEDWKFYKKEMMKHCTDGRESFDSGIKELEENGYLHRTTKHEEKTGKFLGWEWHFFEEPIAPDEFKKILPSNGKPVKRETPTSGKPAPTKNDSVNEKEDNKQADKPPVKKDSPKGESVAVFSCLDEVKISQEDKLWISRNYKEEDVKKALEWVFHQSSTEIKSLPAAIKWACKTKPEVTKSTEQGNIQFAHKLKKAIEGRKFNGFDLEVKIENKYFEFGVKNHINQKIYSLNDSKAIQNILDYTKRLIPELHEMLVKE